MSPQFADIHTALAVLLEFERRLHQFTCPPLRADRAAWHRLAIVFLECRFGIEAVDRGAPAIHEQKNDALHALRIIECGDTTCSVWRNDALGVGEGLTHKTGESHHAETTSDSAQGFAAGHRVP